MRAESLVKFGHTVFKICKRTAIQTDTYTETLVAVFGTTLGSEVKKVKTEKQVENKYEKTEK